MKPSTSLNDLNRIAFTAISAVTARVQRCIYLAHVSRVIAKVSNTERFLALPIMAPVQPPQRFIVNFALTSVDDLFVAISFL